MNPALLTLLLICVLLAVETPHAERGRRRRIYADPDGRIWRRAENAATRRPVENLSSLRIHICRGGGAAGREKQLRSTSSF